MKFLTYYLSVRKGNRIVRKCNNLIDLPVTVFRDHNLFAEEPIMIFGMPGRDDEESDNPFVKPKMIAGNPKSLFPKTKNTFAKIKYYIHLFNNQFTGKNLQHG